MPTTTPKPDHRSLPRKKRPPSARDQALFLASRTQGRTQSELARELNLSQRRISQIIHRVQLWLADGAITGLSSSASLDLDHDQLQRLERQLERERAQAIYDRAIRAHDQAPRELTTTVVYSKSSHSPSPPPLNPEPQTLNPAVVHTTRQLSPSAQFLCVALQANRDLGKIPDKPAPPPPEEQGSTEGKRSCRAENEDALRQQTLDALYTARQKAEDDHKVTKGVGHLDYLATVDRWLAALLGDRPDYFHPDDCAPGTPLAELASFYSRDAKPPARKDEAPAWEGEAPAEPETESSVPTSSVPEPPLGPHDSEAPASTVPLDSSPTNSSNASNLSLANQSPFNSEPKSTTHLASTPTPRPSPPRPLAHHLDDFGWHPSPPNKDDEAQLVSDYLARLRAEHLANA